MYTVGNCYKPPKSWWELEGQRQKVFNSNTARDNREHEVPVEALQMDDLETGSFLHFSERLV